MGGITDEESAKAAVEKITSATETVEGMDFDEPNLRKGAQYIADAYDADFIRESMELERDQYLSRLSEGQRVLLVEDLTDELGVRHEGNRE